MKIFNYNPLDFEFTGISNADPDPLEEGNWLIPANATIVKPPVTKKNEAVTWNSENKKWVKQIDFRGEIYWTPEGNKIEVTEIGHDIPENASVEEPDLRTIEQAINDANDLIKARHAQVLSDLSGNASVEERDTWPLQKEWAIKYVTSQGDHEKSLLLGLMTQAEITALGENATQVMAEKIITKSAAMDLLTSKAGGLKRTAEEVLNSATDKTQIPAILETLETHMITAIAEFKVALNG